MPPHFFLLFLGQIFEFMKIKFIGAAQEVTGSKHLITTDHGKKILLDCGMFQGKGLETDAANRNIMVDPKEIDYIILTHAHIDHCGLIPYFYKLGFRGQVICTDGHQRPVQHHAPRQRLHPGERYGVVQQETPQARPCQPCNPSIPRKTHAPAWNCSSPWPTTATSTSTII